MRERPYTSELNAITILNKAGEQLDLTRCDFVEYRRELEKYTGLTRNAVTNNAVWHIQLRLEATADELNRFQSFIQSISEESCNENTN